ncbi:60S ribosomal protein L18a-like protein [Rhodamnia argentea]|uniref:60S ribosomal protein L18a-like protein n=1 Tax=Rhodamnia argentea TaxID=178133 RepID=A0A8B8QY38_9MYRT|nr:60S ribosomal protein L18a-like protein [Rhodamnia argentea]XP_048131159.1 60S ribosomal protein L18a-like protein [Rhodamnia argentea]XP_048131160.1 60S ribosomal protein L18a-like protein [Rhodamnia argentea]
MSKDEDRNRGVSSSDYQHQYGTFQGVANYPPPNPPHQEPAIGYPQLVPPPGASAPSAPPPPPHQYYHHGYQTVPGYAVAEGRPIRESRLPCCGIGFGWFLFIVGFFLGAIPWYIGLLMLLCGRIDYREKPGYIACTIAAILATIVIVLGVTREADDWEHHSTRP